MAMDAHFGRVMAIVGTAAMQEMMQMHVLVVGLRGVGVEIAKCLALSGVQRLTILDDDLVREEDLDVNFFLRDGDIGKPKSKLLAARLNALGQSFADVRTIPGALTLDLLLNYHLVVFTSTSQYSREDLIAYSEFCRAQSPAIGFVIAESRGAFGFVFTDFGPLHLSEDANDCESYRIITKKTQVHGDRIVFQLHEPVVALVFARGDLVRIPSNDSVAELEVTAIRSDRELEAKVPTVVTHKAAKETIKRLAERADRITKADQVRAVNHKSLRTLVLEPGAIALPLRSEENDAWTFHVAMQAIYAFRQFFGTLPQNNSVDHAKRLREYASAFIKESQTHCPSQNFQLNEALFDEFVRCPAAEFQPLSAVIAGFAAIQALKFNGWQVANAWRRITKHCVIVGRMGPLLYPQSQFMYFDVAEFTSACRQNEVSAVATYGRMSSLVALCGVSFAQLVARATPLLIGTRAFNLEMLKAALCMGIGRNAVIRVAADENKLKETDLATQVLFGRESIGAPVATALERFAPRIQIVPVTPPMEIWETSSVICLDTATQVQAMEVNERCRMHQKPFLLHQSRKQHGKKLQVFVPHTTSTYCETLIQNQSLEGMHPFDHIPSVSTLESGATGGVHSQLSKCAARGIRLFRLVFETAIIEANSFFVGLSNRNQNQTPEEPMVWRIWTIAQRGSRCSSFKDCVREAYKMIEVFDRVMDDDDAAERTVLDVHTSNADPMQLIEATACLVARSLGISMPDAPVRRLEMEQVLSTASTFSLRDHPRSTKSILQSFQSTDPKKLLQMAPQVAPIRLDPDFGDEIQLGWLQAYVNVHCDHAPLIQDLAMFRRFCGYEGDFVPLTTILSGFGVIEMLKVLRVPSLSLRQLRQCDLVTRSASCGLHQLRFQTPFAPRKAQSLGLEVTRGVGLRAEPEGFTRWSVVSLPSTQDMQSIQAIVAYIEAKFRVHIHSLKHHGHEIFRQKTKNVWSVCKGEPPFLLDVLASDRHGDVVMPPLLLKPS